jgi:hypothetical protein
MAKSRHKSGGATRGRLKLKKLGKGWSTMRKKRGSEKPIDRSAKPADADGERPQS